MLIISSITIQPVEKTANIQFQEEVYDFGTIQEGAKPVHSFGFTNTGEASLVILDIENSCGCTEPAYPKEPIEPGKTGVIQVGYNSLGRVGRFDKTITVVSNARDGAIRLRFVGKVVKTD